MEGSIASTRGMEEQRHEEQLPGVALEVANSDAFKSKANKINE